tara:strand:+ start:42 stop:1280 length:1239 start_codon:yes stop_codon:yes gene_type:complete
MQKLKRTNKKKIINDPVYGFITISDEILFDVIEHPYLQRLRRILQLGLTHLVYPGAMHTRFNHVLGAMHLMRTAIATIRRKGHKVSEEEERAVLLAILLHDIGHGPFSHALEYDIVSGITHEELTSYFINELKKEFGSDLHQALLIFENKHPKKYLYELVSSQLDMDRLDYLNRDSFYTGVSEGIIGTERLIDMLNVSNNQLVLEEKGIYSVEKFIIARRLMYWQVYMHKTVVSAEYMLIHILRRAKYLAQKDHEIFANSSLAYFLNNNITKSDFEKDNKALNHFASIDDNDIWSAIKEWQNSNDVVLSMLANGLINRGLFKIEISANPFSSERIKNERNRVSKQFNLTDDELDYMVYSEILSNNAYNTSKQNIMLLKKDGKIVDLPSASDNLNISALAQPVEKYFLCFPSY